MASGGPGRAERKLMEFVQPLLEPDETAVASLPYGVEVVSRWMTFLVGFLGELRNRQYAVVVTNGRVLLVRMRLSGKREIEGAYSRLAVTGSFRKGWLYGALTLTFNDRPPLKLRVHPISRAAATAVAAALLPPTAVPA